MKLFNELLGFVVLTGPLWLIVLTLLAAIVIVVIVTKRFKAAGLRLGIGLSVFALAFLILFGDEVAGRIYLDYLCSTQAGVKVYQTVELPAEYWDEAGEPKFIKGRGALDTTVLPSYDGDFKNEIYPSFFRIKRFRFWFFEKQTGKILGEITKFNFLGGWLMRSFSWSGVSGTSCDLPELQGASKKILLSIFQPMTKQDK